MTVPAHAVDPRSPGSRIPQGWSENPSSWSSRLLLMGLALGGAAVAAYLTLVQTGVLDHAWDPLFGDGSDRVLHSGFSEALPVSDAALGTLAYLADVVLGLVGGTDRWRTMPWVTYLFAAVVVGSAVGGVALALVQLLVVHHFCTLCLFSTAISLVILAVSRLREARASWAHRRQG